MLSVADTAFYIFGIPVRFYGIMIASGVILALMISEMREKRFGLEKDCALSILIIAIPFALVFARIYYVAFNFDEFRHNPVSVLNIRNGGMAIYGGLIGGVFAGWLFSRKHRIPFFHLADFAAPAIAIGQAVGRWGNFFNQEAYGVRIDNPHFQFFPIAVFITRENAYFAAAFFYESMWCLLIALLCLLFEKKRLFRFEGAETLFYAVMYAFERMLVETLRQDSLYLGSIRISQMVSICLMLLCFVILFVKNKKGGKRRIRLITALIAFAAMILCASGSLSDIALLPAGACLLVLSLREIFS